jgi:transposase
MAKERVTVSDKAFVEACMAAGATIESIAKSTGLAASTVQQRRVRMRNRGVPLPELARGGGRRATAEDLKELTNLIAQGTGRKVEELEKQSQELVAAHAERTADGDADASTEAK